MRNILKGKMSIAILAACLLAVPGAFAQTQNATQNAQPEHHQARAERVDRLVGHHLNYLTTVLSLSSTQQQQAKSILMNVANENQPLFASLRAERNDLRTDVAKNEPASMIEQVSGRIGNDVSKLATNEAFAGEHLYKILNPEQQTKLTLFQNENFGRFRTGWGASGM